MNSVNHIINSMDYGGVREYLKRQQDAILKTRGIKIVIGWDKAISDEYVYARVWQGQWIADCECGGASFVQPDDAIFFCFSCANRSFEGRLRRVVFPEDYTLIESLLLDRPVDDRAGLDDRERAGLAKPIIFVEGLGGLSRNWNRNQTLDDLQMENEAVIKWKRGIK